MKKKNIYLLIIIIIFLSFTGWLVVQKSIDLRTGAVAAELQKALLVYIEKEEVFPESIKEISLKDRGLSVSYEKLEKGRGCRFTVAGKTFELWDEVR